MQGQHSNGVAYYRCHYPNEYALANQVQHPRSVYLREDQLIEPLDGWLTGLFAPHRRNHTIDCLAAADLTTTTTDTAVHQAQSIIAECDHKLRRYRAALEAGADPRRRRRLDRQRHQRTRPRPSRPRPTRRPQDRPAKAHP
jgi:hypothetical protein